MSSDYTKKNTDLVSLLPARYRTPINTSMLRNMHNKFLTKEEAVPMLGYVGNSVTGDSSPYISATDLDHTVNALIPTVFTQLGAQEYVFTFDDTLSKLDLLGVDTTKFASWGATTGFNFCPPINLDKFSNYSQYRWYGNCLDIELSYNKTMAPEYYVIASGGVSDWSTNNYWIHQADANAFFASKGWSFTIDSTIQALRPIIEYPNTLEVEMVLHVLDGVPSATGVTVDQTVSGYKTSFNQKPLFNLYMQDGSHSGFVSPIFYYQEGNEFPIDSSMLARIATNSTGDYLFNQGLISPDGLRTLFYGNFSEIKTVWKQGVAESPIYYMPDDNGNPVVGDPASDIENIGCWASPNQMFYNITHENRKSIAFADLFSHFTSIISAQVGFTGNPYGSNNFRNLSAPNRGLGGTIKDYSSNFGLFLGLVNQLDSSVLSIIDFAKNQYASMIQAVTEYVQRNLAQAITSGLISVPSSTISNTVDPTLVPLFNEFLTYVTARNDSTVFADTTSSIPGFPATLPYLGLGTLTQPKVYYDKVVGALMIRHHDGHSSILPPSDITLDEEITNIQFLRSTGQTLPGVSGYVPPSRPFMNQFWFDANTQSLKVYAIASDTIPLVLGPDGNYYYNRTTNILYQYDLATQTYSVVSNLMTPWKVVNTQAAIAQIYLMVENQLYTECPGEILKIDSTAVLAADASVTTPLLEKSFAIYSAIHNLDMTASDYTPTDAFTWNYENATIAGVPSGTARWFMIYLSYFGTQRPNLEPWILQGYTSQPTWWNGLYADTTHTRTWTTQMWSDILNNTTPGHAAPTGSWTKKLCVDITNDHLLPPYVSSSSSNSSQALLNTIPSGISDGYTFGQYGPAEVQYRMSVDFNYDKLKICFTIDPINFVTNTWGYNYVQVEGYTIDRHELRSVSYLDFILHGETPSPKFGGYSVTGIQQDGSDTSDTLWTLTCVGAIPTGSLFSISGNSSGLINSSYQANTEFISAQIRFTVSDNGADFNIGDKLLITTPANTVVYVPTIYAKFAGLNQWFVNMNRYNSVDMSVALANNILRDWQLMLGHRMSGLINTDTFQVETDSFPIYSTDYNLVIKENKNIESYWLNAIRVQLIQVGTTTLQNGIPVPANNGVDWQFRIETFNTYNPVIEYYEYASDDNYQTFYALDKANTSNAWIHPLTQTELVTQTTPFLVTGIQNVVNVIFGYVQKLTDDGWVFNAGINPSIDPSTGRSISWQLYIERFINQQYAGAAPGSGAILNPFSTSVWFNTPQGFVANMRNPSNIDVSTAQVVFDSFGNTIPTKDLLIIRNDHQTEIQSNVVIGGIHLLLDEYEHIALFQDYTSGSTSYLVYDPFLGVRVNRMYMQASRQAKFTGRLTFGGHYINNDQVKTNIEASISNMLNYYDADNMVPNSQTAAYARGLLGYTPKQYMSDIGLSDQTQFNFWRGLISNKGSNLSVNAFLNSTGFQNATIDEFWAYKLATYGDAHELSYPEIYVNSADCQSVFTKIQFNPTATTAQALGFINISPLDESRWVGPFESNADLSYQAEMIAEITFNNIWPDQIYSLIRNGKTIFADTVQVFEQVFLNSGDMTPFLLAVTNYELVNASTILFTSDSSIDTSLYTLSSPRQFVVRCYGPSRPKFNPAKLIDYADEVVVTDLNLWDPARGSHPSEALEIVNIISELDPAKYNYSTQTTDNVNYDPYHAWGELEVGKVWWNMNNVNYYPYMDSNIFPTLESRLAFWGTMADWASVELYEWTESSVPPSEYATLVSQQQGNSSININDQASGNVAMTELYSRNRTWEQRPVAWGYSDAPGSQLPYLSSVGEYQVTFQQDLSGNMTAILSASDWLSEFPSLAIGNKISGGVFYYNALNSADVSNFKLIKPYGEAIFTGVNQDISFGSSTSYVTPSFTPPSYTYEE